MSSFFRAVIMGPPGCGKGTISSFIYKDYKLPHIVCGDILREQIRKSTGIGKTAKQYIEKGQLVPDEVVTNATLEVLKNYDNKHWLLDGFPRNVQQAKKLSESYDISTAININVLEEILVPRLKGRWVHPTSGRTYNDDFKPPKVKGKDDITGEDLVKRDDDNINAIIERLVAFRGSIHGALEFYRLKGVLYDFHGDNSHSIYNDIKVFLEVYFKKHGYPN